MKAIQPYDELDDLDGLSAQELDTVRIDQNMKGTLATAQQEVDDQARKWEDQWAAHQEIEELRWPEEMGEEVEEIMIQELLEESLTFPNETGLGWDRWHPKVLGRLSKPLHKLLAGILRQCGRDGKWPEDIDLVLIALLPKGDGDYRPIGLVPTVPRLWMRIRRKHAKKWEEENAREYLYAGKGKGAEVAAWKQAGEAELAASMKEYVEYAQALLDLVKAFDRVPLWLLIREAVELKYPLRILRLSIAVYKHRRTIRIGKVVSYCVWAKRGITAGSGFATTEMRLVMIRAVDRAKRQFPTVRPTLFVDDLAASVTAPAKHVVDNLGGFIIEIAAFIKSTDQ